MCGKRWRDITCSKCRKWLYRETPAYIHHCDDSRARPDQALCNVLAAPVQDATAPAVTMLCDACKVAARIKWYHDQKAPPWGLRCTCWPVNVQHCHKCWPWRMEHYPRVPRKPRPEEYPPPAE